jgi:hypothetical protein
LNGDRDGERQRPFYVTKLQKIEVNRWTVSTRPDICISSHFSGPLGPIFNKVHPSSVSSNYRIN